MTPYVIEKTTQGERIMDIFSRLIRDRIIFIGMPITDEVANIVAAQMLFLESEDDKADIHLYVNSPGGSVTAGLAIYDIMQHVKCDIATFGVGQCSSMGSLLLSAGTKGKRHAMPNTNIMIHQPSLYGGLSGQVTDIVLYTKELEKTKEKLTRIYEKHTGTSYKKLYELMERDCFMSVDEAKKLGIIDKIITRK